MADCKGFWALWFWWAPRPADRTPNASYNQLTASKTRTAADRRPQAQNIPHLPVPVSEESHCIIRPDRAVTADRTVPDWNRYLFVLLLDDLELNANG
ncbi:hypothetical protein KM043_009647 [Ampulex compressa]|nr:hypothetical protein KM043_009647 [Ampulex compressa]